MISVLWAFELQNANRSGALALSMTLHRSFTSVLTVILAWYGIENAKFVFNLLSSTSSSCARDFLVLVLSRIHSR
jgi:hypothetical protein